MAIDPLLKITVVDRTHSAARLISRLNDLGVVELLDATKTTGMEGPPLRPGVAHPHHAEEHLHKINFILGLFEQFAPEPKSFVAGLAPLPLLIDPQELHDSVPKFDLDDLFHRVQTLEEGYRHHERLLSQVQQEISQLAPFESVAVSMERLHGLKRIRAMLVDVPKKSQEPFLEALAGVEVLACEPLRGGPLSRYWLTFLPQDEARIAALLKEWRAVEVVLPRLHGTAAARLAKLREDLAHAGEGRAGVIRKLQDLAVQRHTLLGLKAFWESEQRKQLAHSQVLKGHWVSVLRGYVRERDLARLEKLLHDEFHSASLTTEPPALHEDVPVSLTHPRLIRPISFLITMYGLPRYNSFDPTAYLTVTFLVFFGICFSDVGYGVMLVLLSLYIRARARAYAHIRQFANLFLLGGISTILFGAVLGSWFGDLHHYLGADNPLERAQRMFAVFDPMGRPVLALVLALVIGAVNQMYGVTLKMYGAVRVGDWFGAIFDGLMWLILLPGLIILISTIFVEISGALLTLGFVLFGIGALGLVLTQGRNEPTLLGKAIVGIISLYGIFGSYGCASFIGDTLSYCRLLALGLTTGIVAMSINLIGGMLRDVPYVGMLLFIGLLIFGHLFNFLISVLGAFIHSARLIFVEFFGRFYEGGARPFRPLSFNSASFQLKE